MAVERLVIEITENGARLVKRSIEEVGTAATKSASSVVSFKNVLLGLGVGFSLSEVVSQLSQFEKAMARIRGLSGLTGGDFDTLTAKAREIGETTEFSATEAAQALGELARAGEPAVKVLQKFAAAQNLAAIQGKGLAETADALDRLLNAFSLEAGDAGRVSDILTVALKKTDINAQELTEQLRLMGPEARAVGAGFEDTVAAVAALGAAGIEGRQAISGLRQIMAALQAPSAEARREFEFLGVQVKDLIPNSGGLVNALKNLRKAGVDTDLAFKLFSKDGEVAFDLLTNKGIKSVTDIKSAFANASGEADKTAKVIRDNVGTELDKLFQQGKNVALAIGEIAKELGLTSENVGKFAEAMRQLAVEIGKAVQAGLQLRDVLVAIKGDASSGSFASILGNTAESDTAKATNAFREQERLKLKELNDRRDALRAQSTPFEAQGPQLPVGQPASAVDFGPVGPQLPEGGPVSNEAVENISKGSAALQTYNDSIREQISVLSENNREAAIQSELIKVRNQLHAEGKDLTSESIQLQLQETENLLRANQAWEDQRNALNSIQEPMQNAQIEIAALNALLAEGTITADDYSAAMKGLRLDAVANDDAWGAFTATLKNMDITQKQLGEDVGTILVGAFDQATDALADFALSGFQNTEDLKKAFSDLFQSIAKEILSLIIKLLILKAIKTVVGGVAGGGGEVPAAALGGEIKAYAAGGFVGSRGEPILVGERGPELFVPPSAGQIVPNHRLAENPQVNVAAPKVIVVSNEEQAKQYLSSEGGERAVIEHIQKNKAQIRQLLG